MIRGVWARSQSLSCGPALSASLPPGPGFPPVKCFQGHKARLGGRNLGALVFWALLPLNTGVKDTIVILLSAFYVPSPGFTIALIQVPGGACVLEVGGS